MLLNKTLSILHRIIDACGYLCVAALLFMIANVFIDVFVRYIVIDLVKWLGAYDWYSQHLHWLGGIGMQELEKHWFAMAFLLGLSYTLKENGHVRVDVFFDNLSRQNQAIINIFGNLIFVIPFCIVIFIYSWDFFINSWISEENKGDPGSLPRLWPFKFLLPLSFMMVILSAIAVVISEWLAIQKERFRKNT